MLKSQNSSLKAIALVPARLASARLPAKALADLGGKPLIIRVCENLQRAQVFSQIVVACDDIRVQEQVERAGFEAILTDPILPSGTDRVAAVAKTLNFSNDQLLVNVQGDEPFVAASVLQAVIARLIQASPEEVVTVAEKITDPDLLSDPNAVKVALGEEDRALYFSRCGIPFIRDPDPRIEQTPWHFRHVGIYAYRQNLLSQLASLPPHPLENLEKLEQLRWLAHGISIRCIIGDAGARGIDTQEDLERARHVWITSQHSSKR